MRSAPRAVSASGRSHSTSIPAAIALSTCGSCRWLGVAIDHRLEPVGLEQILDVGVRVGDAEPVGERARLRAIVVAERDQLHAAHLRQHGKMRDLRDRARAHDADAQRRVRPRPQCADHWIVPTVVPG